MLTSTQKNNYLLPIRWLIVLLPLLVLIIHLFITHGEKKPLLYMLSNWGYYRALLFSMATALGIIAWVRHQSMLLDKRLPWTVNFLKRLWWQLFCGVILPAIFILVLATAYFAYLQLNILHTVYFKRYLFLLVLLLLILNLLGMVWQLFIKRRPYIHSSKIMHQSMLAQEIAAVDIACILIENGQCFYYDLSGQRFFWTKTFKEAIEAFAGDHFFLIRRGALVNRKAIVAVHPEGTSLKLTLRFELPLRLMVSSRNAVDFKHWFSPKSAQV